MSSFSSYADTFNDNDELSGMCFCLVEDFIAVCSCLSMHKLANVLKELCLSGSKHLIALNKPIKPSCIMSSRSAPMIKYFPTFILTISVYLLNK